MISDLCKLFALTASRAHVVCEVREAKGSPGQDTWLQPTAGRKSPEPFWVPETLPALMAGEANSFCRRLWASNGSHMEGPSGVSGEHTCLCMHGTIGESSCRVLLERCLWTPDTCCGVGAGTCLHSTLIGRALSTYQQMEHNHCNFLSLKLPSQPM